MAVTMTRGSTIEAVPALFVALLEGRGDLPTLPAEYAVNRNLRGFRKPGLDEGAALSWVLHWQGPRTEGFAFRKPSGILGYQNRYDWHSASDACSIEYLAGSRRACVELLRWLQKDCRARGRRGMGSVDAHNAPMLRLLCSLGYAVTRTTFEDRGAD